MSSRPEDEDLSYEGEDAAFSAKTDQQWVEHEQKHGYPPDFDINWGMEKLRASELRLMKLSAMNAPAVILENERKIIARRQKWIKSWTKANYRRETRTTGDHPFAD